MTYIFKVDDDIYLRTDRVVPVVRQYVREGIGAGGGGVALWWGEWLCG